MNNNFQKRTGAVARIDQFEEAFQKKKSGYVSGKMAKAFYTVIFLLGTFCPAVASDVGEQIRSEVEQIRYAKEYFVDEFRIGSTDVLPRFYERRDFEPAWKDEKQIDRLIDLAGQMKMEGLNPEDYHLTALKKLRGQLYAGPGSDPRLKAHIDLLLTDSLLRMIYHLAFGKLDPVTQHAGWNFYRDIGDIDPVAFIQAGIESGDIDAIFKSIIPELPIYTRLKAGLAAYRRIEGKGGWRPVSGGETLKTGTAGPRVVELAQRLAATNDLEGEVVASGNFDASIEKAVKRFQRRHGLEEDGTVGRQTLEALNIPVERRIDQIRINLERMRWFLHDLPSTFVVVDIAGFHAYFIQDGEIVWDAKAQVGTPFRETPSFRSEIEYLVFNPTWTVPPGILAKDTLPAIKKDPGYLARMNMTVLDRSGKAINPKSVDWSKYSGRNFPYILRQEPGPNNALGRIKFIFPNRFFVFLHDTPSKSLFEKSSRAFSSGCIRIENPFELAELLLKGSENWRKENMLDILSSMEPKTVFLPEHKAVMLLYWTAQADEYGHVYFKKDIYGRDKKLLKALDGEFEIHRKVSLTRVD